MVCVLVLRFVPCLGGVRKIFQLPSFQLTHTYILSLCFSSLPPPLPPALSLSLSTYLPSNHIHLLHLFLRFFYNIFPLVAVRQLAELGIIAAPVMADGKGDQPIDALSTLDVISFLFEKSDSKTTEAFSNFNLDDITVAQLLGKSCCKKSMLSSDSIYLYIHLAAIFYSFHTHTHTHPANTKYHVSSSNSYDPLFLLIPPTQCLSMRENPTLVRNSPPCSHTTLPLSC